MKASVIVPVFNEKDVAETVSKIGSDYEVIIVDDGSSVPVCHGIKKARCFRLERNMGKGYACRFGASKASCKKIVFIDGDSQLDPRQIPEFVSALDRFDMAIGFRNRGDLPFQRMLSNLFSVVMVFLSTGKYYRDVLCGFRAIKKDKFMQLNLRKNRYEFESEFVIRASGRGFTCIQIPVSVRYKRRGMNITESLKVALYQVKELMRL
jgi:glycosyltransferase involved in cell wall biosynthesis